MSSTDVIKQLIEVLDAQQEWIDAVPEDTALPAMPGFDRDWANGVLEQAKIYAYGTAKHDQRNPKN